jgi:hypothetical protein
MIVFDVLLVCSGLTGLVMIYQNFQDKRNKRKKDEQIFDDIVGNKS